MSVRLRVDVASRATPAAVWRELVDWTGQERWIPLTTVRATSPRVAGLGVRVEALSGFRLGRLPVGLLDRFVVTGWTPPGAAGEAGAGAAGELEVLHLGPYFTGEGVFRVEPQGTGTRIVATEVFSVPASALTERLGTLLLPLMRVGFRASLRRLAAVAEAAA